MGRFVFLFTSMQARSFSPTSEFTGSSIKAKCKPVKTYKRACEKCTSKPVKSPYGVRRYCDMAVCPTRSHLLCFRNKNLKKDIINTNQPIIWIQFPPLQVCPLGVFPKKRTIFFTIKDTVKSRVLTCLV